MKLVLTMLLALSFTSSAFAKNEGAIIGGIIGAIIGNEIDKGNKKNNPMPYPNHPPGHGYPGHGGPGGGHVGPGHPGGPGHGGGYPGNPYPGNPYPGQPYPPSNGVSCQVVGSEYNGSWAYQSCGQCLRNHFNCQETCVAGGAAKCRAEGRDYYGRLISVTAEQYDLNSAQRASVYECQRRGGQNCRVVKCKSQGQQVVSQRSCR